MTKTKRAVLYAVIGVVALALVLQIGYLWLFKGTDRLTDSDFKSLPYGTLTAYLESENGYYKLGNVLAPSGYTSVKIEEDVDGDEKTTQFAYQKRGGQSVLSIYGQTLSEGELSAFSPVTLTYPDDGSNKAKAKSKITYDVLWASDGDEWVALVRSPYEGTYISLHVSGAESEDAARLDAYNAMDGITAAKKYHPIVAQFRLNFIDGDRWQYLWQGLLTTLLITFASGLMGVAIGAVVACIRATWEKNHENLRKGVGKSLLKGLDKACGVYLTVIRGTPVMVQLLIMYLIIFASSKNGTMSAIIAFGINSGAYVAEIVRGGIMSIDHGQFEAGQSLGFGYVKTMIYIILPQAFKNILPSLANEFIALLKETSVSGYVAVKDLNKGGDIIRSVTYSPFMPLIAVALIYLAVVMFFTRLVGLLERRLRSGEHR